MFLNPASTSIFNDNKSSASSSFRRSSSTNENAAPLGMKTPHNNVKSHGSTNIKKGSSSNTGQTSKTNTTQRRRRALGDISNKGSGSAAKGTIGKSSGGGGGLVVKPLSSVNRINNGNIKNRQVKFSKSGGIKSVKSSTSSKLQSTKQRSSSKSSEYDGVFGVTTRWSNTDLDYGRPAPLSQLPKGEFDMAANAAEEICVHRRKERLRKEEEQEQKMEEVLRMKKDVFDSNNVEDDLQEALWELKISPAWEEEEEEEVFDPTNERRLSGTDPVSLWGDILSP